VFKKISALIIVCILLVGAVPTQARVLVSDPDEQMDVLYALGVKDEFSYKVTEGDFLQFLADLVYDDVDLPSPELADFMGVLEDGEIFNETTRISYERALKFSVIALGYKVRAKAGEEYYNIAVELGVTKNISLNKDDVISKDTARQILINMLDAEPLRQVFEKGEIVYKKAVGETILSVGRDIVTIEGIVTANSITSLDAPEGAGEGSIEIEGTEYLAEGNSDDLLGKYVYGFVKQDLREEDTIIYLCERRNTYLSIKDKQFEEISNEVLMYIEDEKNVKRAKLSPNLKVIYNGVFRGDYEECELMPQNGELTLIDNNNDEKYDVAFVNSYQTMVVASVISGDKKIVNAYQFQTAQNILTLDDDEDNTIVRIYDENGEISFSDIKVDDILTVAQSKGNEVITVYKSSNVVEGTIKSKHDADRIIKIDEIKYPYIEELELEITQEGKSLDAGKKYKFYLDYFGNVVYAEYVNEFDYYIFYKCYEDAGEYFISYMDINEKWENATLAKKVTLNNTPMNREAIYQRLLYYEPQVAVIHFNSKGEVKEIQLAVASDQPSEINFIKRNISGMAYRLTPKSFGGEIWLEDDALMFVFPENLNDRIKYSVEDASSLFDADTQYVVTAYDFDDFGFTRLLSMHETANVKTPNTALFLVTDIFTTCIGDEVFTAAKGACADFNIYQLNGEDENTFAGVEPGDVIRVHTNRNGRIDEVSTCIKTDRSRFVKRRSHLGNTVNYNRNDITTGVISKIDISEKRIKIDAGENAVFRLKDTIPITVYDSSTRTCRAGSISDLSVGDTLVCRTAYLQLQEVFVIRY